MPANKYYAGIGSRETPANIQLKMTAIAHRLDSMGYCLRSGGADGADSAFEKGATKKQIFLPWNGFCNKHADGINYFVPAERLDFVEKFHPKYSALSRAGLSLMSRNSYQVLGPNLNNPVDFVLCWTKEGKMLGGTAQALRIAQYYRIPIFNMESDGISRLSEYIIRINQMYSNDDWLA